jgi:hypothetical protein
MKGKVTDMKTEKTNNTMTDEKTAINEKKILKENALKAYQNNEVQAIHALVSSIELDDKWRSFWYEFKLYRIHIDLGFEKIEDYIRDKFNISGVGSKKRIEHIENKLNYLFKIGNPAYQKAKKEKENSKPKTDLEKCKALCDGMSVDDLMLLQTYIENLLSSAESMEQEEKEERKIKKAA